MPRTSKKISADALASDATTVDTKNVKAVKKPAKAKPLTTKKAVVKPAIDQQPKTAKKTVTQPIIVAEQPSSVLAKAGRRSAKAIKEDAEKIAKEQRKLDTKLQATNVIAKPIIKQPRTRLERKGKKFQLAAKQIDKNQDYNLKSALDLAVKTSPVKFDATVEIHIKLGVDPRQADQNIRANLILPEGNGKITRVAVFADDDNLQLAKQAGADITGSDEFLQALDKNQLSFDTLIATPSMMPKLAKYARLLGPKGLMPNPKSGTVTNDIKKAVREAKAGRVEYRVDSSGIVHVGIGKVSFGSDKLQNNVRAVFASIKSAKPASIKGNYIESIYVATSMGPSVKITNSEI